MTVRKYYNLLPKKKSRHYLYKIDISRDIHCTVFKEYTMTQTSVQFCSLSHVQLFETPWTAAHQASLSINNSWSLLKLMSIESVMPSPISASVVPFSSCLQSFPASGSFPMSQFFISGGQNIGVSASTSIVPMNIQD